MSNYSAFGIKNCNCFCERGTSSKCKSLAYADYVPVFCTHRPSLPRTELIREDGGDDIYLYMLLNPFNRIGLNQAKVVTRWP